MKKILLTFDLEEFDSPKDFGKEISEERMFEIAKEGFENVKNLLEKHKIIATFFTTANFAKRYPQLLKNLSKNHEIACHGYYHSDDYKKETANILLAKKEIEEIIGKNIKGFRAPRFGITNLAILNAFGFEYDSSLHPTIMPGRYFNFFKKRKIHKVDGIIEIPLSVLPFCRLPIFWLAFKNFPISYSKIFTKINFASSKYTMLVFHPWEFADLSKISLPNYVKNKHGQQLIDLLGEYILFCKKNDYKFAAVSDFLFPKSFK